MVDIDFDLNQSHTIIQANLTDKFQDVISKYFGKSLIKPESFDSEWEASESF